MSGEEVLEAASLSGLHELCGHSVHPRLGGTRAQDGGLAAALRCAAKGSRRTPTVSGKHLREVVAERAAHVFRGLGDAARLSTGGLIDGVVGTYNRECVGQVIGLTRALDGALAVAGVAVEGGVTGGEELSWGGLIDEDTVEGVLGGALEACRGIVGGAGGAMAEANARSMCAREVQREGGMEGARRTAMAMLRDAVLHRLFPSPSAGSMNDPC